MDNDDLSTCGDCGAVVTVETWTMHAKWHEDLIESILSSDPLYRALIRSVVSETRRD